MDMYVQYVLVQLLLVQHYVQQMDIIPQLVLQHV